MLKYDLRLTLKILHDVEKPIVHIWLLGELYLNLIQVAQGILKERQSCQ